MPWMRSPFPKFSPVAGDFQKCIRLLEVSRKDFRGSFIAKYSAVNAARFSHLCSIGAEGKMNAIYVYWIFG